MSRRVVVVKVGGSLLDWPELPRRLGAFLEERGDENLVLVVGGGSFADVLRDLDQRFAIGEDPAHALALRVLDLTAHLLEKLVPGTRVVDRPDCLNPIWSDRQVPILAPRQFLDDDDRSPDPLPHTWSTTTDAIAARLAVRIKADELILLKSREIPSGIDADEAARIDLVDPEFPRAAIGIPLVVYRNFRESSHPVLIETDPPAS